MSSTSTSDTPAGAARVSNAAPPRFLHKSPRRAAGRLAPLMHTSSMARWMTLIARLSPTTLRQPLHWMTCGHGCRRQGQLASAQSASGERRRPHQQRLPLPGRRLAEQHLAGGAAGRRREMARLPPKPIRYRQSVVGHSVSSVNKSVAPRRSTRKGAFALRRFACCASSPRAWRAAARRAAPARVGTPADCYGRLCNAGVLCRAPALPPLCRILDAWRTTTTPMWETITTARRAASFSAFFRRSEVQRPDARRSRARGTR